MQGSVSRADLGHHTYEVVDSDICPVGLVDEGQELIAELYDGLPLLLARVEELLPPEVDRANLKEVVVEDANAGHESLDGGVYRSGPRGFTVGPRSQCLVDAIVKISFLMPAS